MGIWITYTLVTGMLLAIMYIVYRWLIAREKQPALNRIIILGCFTLAATLPLLDLASQSNLYGGHIVAGQLTVTGIDVNNNSPTFSLSNVLINTFMYIYLAGAFLIFSSMMAGQIKILWIINHGQKIKHAGYILVLTDQRVTIPFSWHRYIVMNRDDYNSKACASILAHELTHVARRHSIDLIIANIFCVAIWYNPAVWCMAAELRSTHEYEADQNVLNQGYAPRDYQLTLIKKAVGKSFPVLANSLNHSNLKKRITMMQKSNSTKSRRARVLALIPAAALGLAVINTPLVSNALERLSDSRMEILSNHKDSENLSLNNLQENFGNMMSDSNMPDDNNVVKAAEKMPQFPGGEIAMMEFLRDHIQFPESEMNRAEGRYRVVVTFVVKATGKIGDISIVRSEGEAFDNEAKRVVSLFPDFIPGTVDGKPVSVTYTLPVVFAVHEKDNTSDKAK